MPSSDGKFEVVTCAEIMCIHCEISKVIEKVKTKESDLQGGEGSILHQLHDHAHLHEGFTGFTAPEEAQDLHDVGVRCTLHQLSLSNQILFCNSSVKMTHHT